MIEGPYKLPEGWRWVRLGEVCLYERRTIEPRRFPDTGFYLYSIPAYDKGQEPERLTGSQIGSGKIVVEPGVCLFSKLNPRIPRAWVVTEVPQDGVSLASTEFMPLRPNTSVLDLGYLGKLLVTEGLLSQVRSDVTGATGSRQRLKPEAVLNALIPLPPLSEQQRIVARIEELMGRVQEARRLREEAKQDAERLWQAVLAETFPRPGTELPEGWRWVRLGEVCEHKTGIWGPEAPDTGEGFPVVRSTEIAGYQIEPQRASVRLIPRERAKDYVLQSGDILVNKSSGSPHLVGWSAIFEDPGDGRVYLFSNFMLRLRLDQNWAIPWFVLYYLHSPGARVVYLSAQDTTSGLRNLRVSDFMSQPIPLPSLSEQRRIVAHLEAVQARIKALKEAQAYTEAELKRLEQAVLEKAFRGEL